MVSWGSEGGVFIQIFYNLFFGIDKSGCKMIVINIMLILTTNFFYFFFSFFERGVVADKCANGEVTDYRGNTDANH